MSLILWTSADPDTLNRVVGPIVSKYVITHRVEPDVYTIPMVEPGDVLLAFGTKALNLLAESGLTPKKRTVGSMRETSIPYCGAKILVTYDPTIVSVDYARLPEVQWDINLSIRLHNTGTMRPEVGEYTLVESLHEIILRVEEKYEQTGKPVDLACDLETKGLDEYAPGAWIISCSFTVDEGYSQVLYFKRGEVLQKPRQESDDLPYWEAVWTQVNWLLTTPKAKTRGANFKFDARWLSHIWDIDCTNFKLDTLLVGSLLDENRSNSLKLHAKIFTNMGGYEDEMDKYDFSCLEKVPVGELVQYNGGDTDVTMRVGTALRGELMKDRALANLYINLVHPASRVFEKVERTGVLVDLPYYKELEKRLVAEIGDIHKTLIGMLPGRIRAKYSDNLKITRPALMKDFMFSKAGLNLKPLMVTEKAKEPSTAMEHLLMFSEDERATNFIEEYKKYTSATKTLSTFVVGFLKHLRSDGRFHPSYLLFRGGYGGDGDDAGTVTGRSSAKDPAIQTLPKHTTWAKLLRRCLIAPPGMTILQLDYSQGELRITAVVANEPAMLQAYMNHEDLHSKTAAKVNGYSLVDFMLLEDAIREELRYGGKAGNFGLIYGMQHKGYRDYAASSYGVKMTEQEAYEAREAFFELYNRLPLWHDEFIGFARKWGFVRSPLGRVRHLPLIRSSNMSARSKAERQAINAPIQSTLSDMMQRAMVEIDRVYGDQVQMFMMTHDSVAMYVPEDEAPVWAGRCKDIMENLPLKEEFGWESPLKFIVDAEAGMPDDSGIISMASLKKLKISN